MSTSQSPRARHLAAASLVKNLLEHRAGMPAPDALPDAEAPIRSVSITLLGRSSRGTCQQPLLHLGL